MNVATNVASRIEALERNHVLGLPHRGAGGRIRTDDLLFTRQKNNGMAYGEYCIGIKDIVTFTCIFMPLIRGVYVATNVAPAVTLEKDTLDKYHCWVYTHL